MRHASVALFLFVLASTSVAAQSTWESHTRTGEYAFAIGDTARAEQEFQAALKIAQRLPPPDERLETSLGNLARLYEHDGRFDQALPMYQLQAASAEVRVGENDPELLQPLLGLARVAMQSGDIPAAEDALQHYRRIAGTTGATDPSQQWVALAMLARTLTLQERDDEALAAQREAVAVLDSAHGPTAVERATALESQAQMELLHGSADAAEDLLVRAAELRASDEEGGGTAVMLTAAAETAFGAGEFEVADRLAARAMTATETEGRNPYDVMKLQADIAWMRVRRGSENLANLYLGASPGPDLDAAYDRLLSIHGAVAEENDPAVIAENLSRLAQVAALRGEVEDCAHWQGLFIDGQRQLFGADSSQAMTAQENLVELLTAAGDHDRALIANEWLITAQERAWGEDSPRLRPVLERQLDLLTRAGLKKQAKQVKKRLKKL